MFCVVNEKAVATDEVYFATENGQIFDCDYRNMNCFRKDTLFELLAQVPSTIGRMSRPNNIVEKYRQKRRQSLSYSQAGGRNRADGSMADDSEMSGRAGLNLKRRGTVNFMKNVMYTKIQKA